jgi:hypothetical protein
LSNRGSPSWNRQRTGGGGTPADRAKTRPIFSPARENPTITPRRSFVLSGLRNGEQVACQTRDCTPLPFGNATSARYA